MKPKFADSIAWQQAELLMQPVFIRLIDNLRKAVEQSTWKGTYQETPVWAEEVSEETQERVIFLQQQLKTATPETLFELEEALARLPQPFPSYQLQLQQGDRTVQLDLWQLCYQICFRNYSPPFDPAAEATVEIDTSLIDEFGEVDWQQIETKTQRLVKQFFANLPTVESDPSPSDPPSP